jgi:hypothetical protein
MALQLDRLFGSARQAYEQLQVWNRTRLIVHLVDFNGEPWDTFGERGKTLVGVLAGMAQWERHYRCYDPPSTIGPDNAHGSCHSFLYFRLTNLPCTLV